MPSKKPTTRQKAPAAGNGAPRLFHVDCKLSYTLLDDTHFLFLVHALDGMDQKVLDESLRITPALEHEVHADAVFGHRTLRLRRHTGPLTLALPRAGAWWTARRPRADAGGSGRSRQLPHDVLPDLLPTRYCEADRLASAAFKMFGDVEPGYARVQAMSDWIHEQRGVPHRLHRQRPRRLATCSCSARACAAISRTWASRSAAR